MPRWRTLLQQLCMVTCFFCFYSCTVDAKACTGKNLSDTCKYKRSRTFSLYFNLDTTTSDFYRLLHFIESKGEFSRFNSDHTIDSSTVKSIVLKKILCWEKLYQSPVEYWKLRNLFSISYYLQSKKSTASQDQPSFSLTQLNFTDSKQMEIAAEKIIAIRWGEPLLAWNFWFLIKGNSRLYIIQTSVPGYIDAAERYRNMIRDEWVK